MAWIFSVLNLLRLTSSKNVILYSNDDLNGKYHFTVKFFLFCCFSFFHIFLLLHFFFFFWLLLFLFCFSLAVKVKEQMINVISVFVYFDVKNTKSSEKFVHKFFSFYLFVFLLNLFC